MQLTNFSVPLTSICVRLLSFKPNMDDYQNASQRHFIDAEILWAQKPSRLANASHLFGVSAECALKAIVRKHSPTTKFYGASGHIPKLFAELLNITPINAGNSDLAKAINSIHQHFPNWDVEQRYWAQTSFTEAVVAQERIGADRALLLMRNHLQGTL